MDWTAWGIVLKGIVYVAAFWLFGWKIVDRKPLPSLGWALLGGLGRWLAGLILGGLIYLFLASLGLPFGLVLGAMAIFRLAIWLLLASFLFEPRLKQALYFALVMTLINFGIDLALFGPPRPEEFLRPVDLGHWH